MEINYKEEVNKILEYLNIELEEGETLTDYGRIEGDDIEDIWKRKFLLDLVVAKKLGILNHKNFLDAFNYRK